MKIRGEWIPSIDREKGFPESSFFEEIFDQIKELHEGLEDFTEMTPHTIASTPRTPELSHGI